MRILICAAGSGGHIYPALSLAEELKLSAPGVEIIFFCTKKSIEKKIFSGSGDTIFSMDLSPFPAAKNKRNFVILSLKYLLFLIKFISEYLRIIFLLSKIRPAVAISFGGMSGFAVICAAKMLGITSIIHEQNIVPGLANRLSGKIADKIAVGFKQTEEYFKHMDVLFTGNPIRKDLKKIGRKEALDYFGLNQSLFTILVFGGSQGSLFINKSFIHSLKQLSPQQRQHLQVLHLAGEENLLSIEEEYRVLNIKAKTFGYFSDMGLAYSAADLAVCRAGAITISELNFFAVPAILIPYPYARAHQTVNAEVMQAQGNALLVAQDSAASIKVSEIISGMLCGKSGFFKTAPIKDIFHDNQAAARLAAAVIDLANKRGN